MGWIQTLWKGGLPAGFPQEKRMLGHYLLFFVSFTHKNDKFSNNRRGANPLQTLEPPLIYLFFILTEDITRWWTSFYTDRRCTYLYWQKMCLFLYWQKMNLFSYWQKMYLFLYWQNMNIFILTEYEHFLYWQKMYLFL